LKLLWGRAAGRCSICKIIVTADKESVTDAYPFGENAHIVAEKPGGPRGDDGLSESLRNNYLNLILLCPTCHTKIDKAPEDFPPERLLGLLDQITLVARDQRIDIEQSDENTGNEND